MSALVYIRLASFAEPAMRTAAHVVVDNVGALTPVLTGLLQALVDIFFTEAATESGQALALESVDLVHALALVQTGV